MEKGVIEPAAGVDKEFDFVNREIESINDELKSYLKTQEKKFGCRLNYTGADKKRFQIEIPERNCEDVDSSFTMEGQRKGFKRYYTAETKVR